MNVNINIKLYLPVWGDRIRRLATDPVVMRSSPATGYVRWALLVS